MLYSRKNSRSPFSSSSSIYPLSKSKSTTNFFQKAISINSHMNGQPTTNIYHYNNNKINHSAQLTQQDSSKDCLACLHEKHSSHMYQHKNQQGTKRKYQDNDPKTPYYKMEYYGMEKTYKEDKNKNRKKKQTLVQSRKQEEVNNLKNSKLYLEESMNKQKIQFQQILSNYEHEVYTLNNQLSSKNEEIKQITEQLYQHHSSSRYINKNISSSNVMPYSEDQFESHAKEMEKKERKIRQLSQRLFQENAVVGQLKIQMEAKNVQIQKYCFMLTNVETNKHVQQSHQNLNGLIQNIKEEYESIIERLKKEHKMQLQFYYQKCQELKTDLEGYRNNNNSKLSSEYQNGINQQQRIYEEFRLLKEMNEQKTIQCEKLASKVDCVEQQLQFIVHKFQHLLQTTTNLKSITQHPDTFYPTNKKQRHEQQLYFKSKHQEEYNITDAQEQLDELNSNRNAYDFYQNEEDARLSKDFHQNYNVENISSQYYRPGKLSSLLDANISPIKKVTR